MLRAALLAITIAATTACAATADLASAAQLERVMTGWMDAGMVDGKHKLVPAATFVLKNASDQKLGPVQVNAVFRQIGDPKEWSFAYVPNAARELAPGASTGPITVRGDKGYTSEDPADSMLQNAQFVDATLQLLVRSGSSGWTKLGDYPIERTLIVPANIN